MPLHVQEPQRLFLWLRQVPPALQTLWRWRRWQTAQPSWPGAPAETTAAPLPITSSRPGLPSLWAGRGLTQVGSGRKMIFHLIPDVMVFRWIPAEKFSYSREVRVWGQLRNGGLCRWEGFRVWLGRTRGHRCCFLHDLILTTLLTFTPAAVLEPDSAFHLLKPVVLKLGEFPRGWHRITAVGAWMTWGRIWSQYQFVLTITSLKFSVFNDWTILWAGGSWAFFSRSLKGDMPEKLYENTGLS